MWKDKDARYSFHCLQGQRPLTFQFLPAPFSSSQEFSVPVFGLSQTAICASNTPFLIFIGFSDFFIRTLQQLGQGQIDMFDYALHLCQTLFPCFLEKRLERALM
jgi:hypothetical protein